MKLPPKYFYFILFFTFPLLSLSQTSATASIGVKKTHEKLINVFGADWVVNNPEVVDLLENCYANRIVYQQEPLTASDKYTLLSTVPLMTKNNPTVTGANFQNFNPETFNPFTYSIEFLSDKIQVFRIDGTNWIMVISPVIR